METIRIEGVRPYGHDGTFWRVTLVVHTDTNGDFRYRTRPIEGPRDSAKRVARAMAGRFWPGCSMRVKSMLHDRAYERYFKAKGSRPWNDGMARSVGSRAS